MTFVQANVIYWLDMQVFTQTLEWLRNWSTTAKWCTCVQRYKFLQSGPFWWEGARDAVAGQIPACTPSRGYEVDSFNPVALSNGLPIRFVHKCSAARIERSEYYMYQADEAEAKKIDIRSTSAGIPHCSAACRDTWPRSFAAL
jgi:hypothetical protein